MITFEVEDKYGVVKTVEVPEGISLTLMEVLKASSYNILATCGGMALCATCHIEIKRGHSDLVKPNEIELDMMDTLPQATMNSRLACQVNIDSSLQNAFIALKE